METPRDFRVAKMTNVNETANSPKLRTTGGELLVRIEGEYGEMPGLSLSSTIRSR